MNRHRQRVKSPLCNRLYAAGAIVVFAGVIWWIIRQPVPAGQSAAPSLATSPAPQPPTAPAASESPASAQRATESAPASEPVRAPGPVASRPSGDYEWAVEDGKDTNVMRRLAHNEGEFERMVQENPALHRRQLVYHKTAFSLAAQRAVHFAEPVSQLTLPGLDGQEFRVEVLKSELEAGGDRGVFTGRLLGRADSMVTVAFIGGREAFTVFSPDDQIYLTAEPREPGEIVVKSIDPNSYGGVLAGCGVIEGQSEP